MLTDFQNLSPSSSCIGPTALHNRQEVEQIKTDVYEQFFSSRFKAFLTFFYFSETFFTSMRCITGIFCSALCSVYNVHNTL